MNSNGTAPPQSKRERKDYQLIGGASEQAAAAGLVNAQWYRCNVPRSTMKLLMQRSDGPAIRDTIMWYATIFVLAALFVQGWNAYWHPAVLFAVYFLYATLYCSPADSRWHESGHGTAFRTRWMNEVLYQLASFQVLRRPTKWRWSHARHHTDTLIVGRDPEVAVKVPVNLTEVFLNCFAIKGGPRELWAALCNALGHIDKEEKTFVPEMEWPRMVREARAWVLVYVLLFACAVLMQSWLPLLLLGLIPGMLGAWLFNLFGFTQHAGMPENVLDHRLNCRTVYMNPVFRFLYWNMNYHLEHHMFPMVPYHALPKMHEAVKGDCPAPYLNCWQAYSEIFPMMLRQSKDPQQHVTRSLVRADQTVSATTVN
jgi:fatty acid desaturase